MVKCTCYLRKCSSVVWYVEEIYCMFGDEYLFKQLGGRKNQFDPFSNRRRKGEEK